MQNPTISLALYITGSQDVLQMLSHIVCLIQAAMSAIIETGYPQADFLEATNIIQSQYSTFCTV